MCSTWLRVIYNFRFIIRFARILFPIVFHHFLHSTRMACFSLFTRLPCNNIRPICIRHCCLMGYRAWNLSIMLHKFLSLPELSIVGVQLIDITDRYERYANRTNATSEHSYTDKKCLSIIPYIIKRVCQSGMYFRRIYDNYKSSVYRDYPTMSVAIRESRGYILPKRPDPGRFGSSTYSCGIKVGRLAGADRHRAGDGKKREQKGPWRESRLFMTRGGTRNGNLGLFEQRGQGKHA